MFTNNRDLVDPKREIECQIIQYKWSYEVIVTINDINKHRLFISALDERLKKAEKSPSHCPYMMVDINFFGIISLNVYEDFATLNFRVPYYIQQYEKTYNILSNKEIYLSYSISSGKLHAIQLSNNFLPSVVT